MLQSTPTIVIGLLALMASFAATPAMATDTRTAIKLCDANPKCGYTVGDGGVTIVVNDGGGGGGGATVIDCPAINGECQVVIKKRKATIVGPLFDSLSSGDSGTPAGNGGSEGGGTMTLYDPAQTIR